jgi:hypothetical protein
MISGGYRHPGSSFGFGKTTEEGCGCQGCEYAGLKGPIPWLQGSLVNHFIGMAF